MIPDLETLTMPFRFGFMQNAFAMAIVLAVPTALLSCFLVLKGWALMGDAISHAILPGIVIAHILGAPLVLGAFGAGMASALATGYLAQNSRVKSDTVMGIVFSGMFGLGIVLFAASGSGLHLDHILFGNLLGVSAGDLVQAAVISAVVAGALILKWKDWLLHAFDPAQARASGLAVGVLHYGLLALVTLTIIATLTAAGLILAVALLIAPGAIAFLLARRFSTMLWVAVSVNLVAMTGGIYLSFHLDSAPAPTIVLVLTALFILALICRQIRTRQT
jgi:manganese/iron transport system permease protein